MTFVKKTKDIRCWGWDVQKGNAHPLLVKPSMSTAPMENTVEMVLETKNRATL